MDKYFEKYFNRLNTTDEWKRRLIALTERTNEMGRRVVVVTIARKMARLFEFHRKKDNTLDNLFKLSNPGHNVVITEHAVPVCLDILFNSEIIILDDLMVYGDTVETVSENIFYRTGVKPKVIAMAATSLTDQVFRFAELIYPVADPSRKDSPDIIDSEEIPAFTAKNNWDIISLEKSIDLEHTILRVDGDFSDLVEKVDEIVDIVRKTFKNAIVYPVVHDIPGGGKTFSVSVLFDRESEFKINEDFAKIRIFFGRNGISITSYTPNFWDETILSDESLRFGIQELNEIWAEIKTRLFLANQSARSDSDALSSIIMDRLKRDFNLRVELSAVIIANYLLSFESVMILKPLLKDAIKKILEDEEPQFRISSRDMSLLIGSDLSKLFQPKLQEVVSSREVKRFFNHNKVLDESIRLSPLIPSEYIEQYNKEKLQDLNLSSNVPMALSLIFYRLWKSFGTINQRMREDRIKVGETFDSLFESLSVFFDKDNLLEQIHRWIDANIDLGVVVPKYEYFIDRLGYRVWRRYFRAGERESVMTDVARAALLLLIDNLDPESKVFKLDLFEDEVFPALVLLSIDADGQLNLDDFKKSQRFFFDSEDGMFPLWAYLVIINAISLTEYDWDSASIVDYDGHPLFVRTALYKP